MHRYIHACLHNYILAYIFVYYGRMGQRGSEGAPVSRFARVCGLRV